MDESINGAAVRKVLMRATLRDLADAWDEGYRLGHKCVGVDPDGCDDFENPYRVDDVIEVEEWRE